MLRARQPSTQGVFGLAVLIFFAAVVFVPVDFDAVDLAAVVFFAAVVFAAVDLDAVDFDAVVFFAVVVLAAVVFLAGAFFAGALRVVVFFAGPFARFSASRVAARSSVTASTESSLRRVAFVSPSVTYGPKRPSLTTTGFFVSGSSPSSFSGAAARRPPRCFGSA